MTGFFRRNAILAAIEIVGRIPLLFVVGYLASSVGPDVYGDWALVLAATGILTGLGALGLGVSMSRNASATDADEARGYLLYALRITTAVVVVFGVALLLGRDPFGSALGITEGRRGLLAVGGLLALGGTVEALLDAYFKARERLGLQAVLVIGRTCIDVVVVLVVFGTSAFDLSADERLYAYVGLSFGAKALLLYPWLILAPPRATRKPDKAARASFVRYGLPMIPTALVLWLTTQGDRLVLGHAVSHEQLGWYAFGAALAFNLTYLGLAIYPLLLPRASVLHDREEHDEVVRMFAASQWVYLSLFGGVAIALAILAPDIIRATAGEEFAPAASILLLLALAVGLEGLLGIFQWVFHLVRRPSLVLGFNLVYMVLQVGAVFTVATITGDILAVAWTALVVVVVANLIRYVIARRLYVVRLSPAVVAALAGVGALVLAGAELGQDLPLALRLASAAVVGCVALLAAARSAGVRTLGRLVPLRAEAASS